MSGRHLLDTLQLSLRVPRGIEGFWTIIKELDEVGTWTITDVASRTNVHKRNVSDYVQGLRVAGIVRQVGERIGDGRLPAAAVYRLARRPVAAPRVSRDGTEQPETAIELLWRTMKIAKSFTYGELAELASTPDRAINRNTSRRYLLDLLEVGVVGKSGNGANARFRLVLNLGARAPKILQTHVVFDPNSNAVLGQATAREVKP